MIPQEEIFSRSRMALGEEVMERLRGCRVIIFGVGGVGSWAAEALVRTGLTNLTIVDSDDVAPSNINRQLMATTLTVGEPKVEALKRHLLTINPDARITAVRKAYTPETADSFPLSEYDYVIDAIDSLSNKMLLILRATASGATFYSSMGAASKVDPTRIRTAEFYKVQGCPLARALRQKFKRAGEFPARKFRCVYSDEPPRKPISQELPRQHSVTSTWDSTKAVINGSLMPVTATFGLTLASLLLQDLLAQVSEPPIQM